MKVLWLCNIILPAIAKELGIPYSNREGWLTGAYERFIKAEDTGVQLGICFPWDKKGTEGSFSIGSVRCYGFYEDLDAPEQYDPTLEKQLADILQDFQPDVVHIFGTEFPHALAMTRVIDRPERILLGIQGLCYKIAEVYTEGVPCGIMKRSTFRDWMKKDSMRDQKYKFELRGEHEKEIIRRVKHITGRTRFDREGTAQVNPAAIYYAMNETMRECFYTGRWEAGQCEEHSIFLSQGDYPVKGFHYMLQAMPVLLEKYPDTRLYVAGNSIIEYAAWKDKIKISSYGKYLRQLITENSLQGKVTILGKLDADDMKERFLQSSVFVCPSIIENSPNAVAEAMLLGMPVVAAATGGIPDMITDGKEGLLYEPGNIAALAQTVERVWQEGTAAQISWGAAARAADVHNKQKNYERMMEIYNEINLYLQLH